MQALFLNTSWQIQESGETSQSKTIKRYADQVLQGIKSTLVTNFKFDASFG